MLVALKVTSKFQCYLKFLRSIFFFFFIQLTITEWCQKWKAVSVGATNMQQPRFYILLYDYFISHQLLTRHCSLHMFWMGKQIMQVKVKFSVFRTIWGFNFIPWESVIFFYTATISRKGRATPEKFITDLPMRFYPML